jgi:hypothetical protein
MPPGPALGAQSISAARAHGCRFGRPRCAAAPRRRPWKRAVLAPTAAAPLSRTRTVCAHEETFGLPATRRLALCDVPHIASPRRCPKWQARKPRCQSIDNGRPVMATTTFAFARFSAGNMGRAWLVTLAPRWSGGSRITGCCRPDWDRGGREPNRQSFRRGIHGLCSRRASHSARSSSDHRVELRGFMCAGNHYGRDRHRWDAAERSAIRTCSKDRGPLL